MNKTASLLILIAANVLIFVFTLSACVYLWGDSNPTNDGNTAIVLTAGLGFQTAVTALWKMIADIHRDINSRMDDFLDEARKASRAEGVTAGTDAERLNPMSPTQAVVIQSDAEHPVTVKPINPK